MFYHRYLTKILTIKRVTFGVYTINGFCVACNEPIDRNNIEPLYRLFVKIRKLPLLIRIGNDKLYAKSSKCHFIIRIVENDKLDISLSKPTFDGIGKYHSNTTYHNIKRGELFRFVQKHCS